MIADIIFQSVDKFVGESNSIWNIVAPLIGVFIGAAATYYAALISIKNSSEIAEASRKADRETLIANRERELKESYTYFRLLVLSSIEIINRQIDHLEKYISQLDNSPYEIPEFTKVPFNDVKRAIEIDMEKLLHAHAQLYSHLDPEFKTYRKIISRLDAAYLQLSQLENIHNRLSDLFFKFFERYDVENKHLNDFINNDVLSISPQDETEGNVQILHTCGILTNNMNTMKKERGFLTIVDVQKQYVEYLEEHLRRWTIHPIGAKILTSCSALSKEYTSISETSLEYKGVMSIRLDALKKFSEELSECFKIWE